MRGSKEKKNLMITTTTTSNSNCFTSILKKGFACGANLPSPTPSDHLVLPKFKPNGYVYPNPNELESPTSTNPHFVSFEADFVKDDGHHPRQQQPGLVARLMGLESMPNHRDSVLNLRSKSLNSLHLYIFPDTFLDHVSSSPQFSQHQRQKPCHRRAQSTFPVMCVEPSPSKEKTEPYTCNLEDSVVSKPENWRKKVDDKDQRKKSKKNNQRTRKHMIQKDDPRKEIKCKDSGAKSRKERRVCRIRNADELKIKVDEKGHHRNHVSVLDRRRDFKDDSAVRPRRRRSSRKISTDQQNDNQEQIPRCFQGKKSRSKTREDTEECKDLMADKDLMAQVIKLTEEECVRDDEWVKFDENVKEVGVEFAGEMLLVLINQFLDELLLR